MSAISTIFMQADLVLGVMRPPKEIEMLYAVLFTDDPAHANARQRLMPAHLAFLEKHRDRIRAAGPLREGDDGEAAGGLWLVEAASADEVAALYKDDPLWPTGLRRSVRVLRWSQVFADGRRQI
jgi:uncharacterized protein